MASSSALHWPERPGVAEAAAIALLEFLARQI
jgi:hypothetical protein